MAQPKRAFLNLTLFHLAYEHRKTMLLSRISTTGTAHTKEGTDAIFRMHSRWGSPVFHVLGGCCDACPGPSQAALYSTWETHSCPTVSTSPWTRPGLDAPVAQYARHTLSEPSSLRQYLHHLATPRDPPAVCLCDNTAQSSERSSLDLAHNLIALPMHRMKHVCGGAQPTATCSAYGE